MDQPVKKHLLQKYLSGECNAAELQTMNDFLKRKDAQQLIDEVLAEEWDVFQEQEISDQEITGWKTLFEAKRLPVPTPVIKKLSVKKHFFRLPYAAVWIGLLLCVGTWYGIVKPHQQNERIEAVAMLESENPMGQRSKIILADGSTVYLAGGSKLSYPASFSGGKREISLKGEAFFEITKNPKKPFIIHTGDVQTQVLGTSFRINAFNGRPMVVEVATGKVRVDQLSAQGAKSIAILIPGQSLKWEDKSATLGAVSIDDLKEWKNGRLAFNAATLQEITSVLERWYNVKVAFKDSRKANRHITITLTANVPVTEIMDVLAQTGSFKYRLKGNRITIN